MGRNCNMEGREEGKTRYARSFVIWRLLLIQYSFCNVFPDIQTYNPPSGHVCEENKYCELKPSLSAQVSN